MTLNQAGIWADYKNILNRKRAMYAMIKLQLSFDKTKFLKIRG